MFEAEKKGSVLQQPPFHVILTEVNVDQKFLVVVKLSTALDTVVMETSVAGVDPTLDIIRPHPMNLMVWNDGDLAILPPTSPVYGRPKDPV
ncbi:UNVERIFIED_CONTAM: hypothetical protein K2H54_036014 [Gekko kuhli]